jgi:hypothetical protein
VAELIEVLDRFLEAAWVVQRDKALAKGHKRLTRRLAKAFRAQGNLFVKRLAALEGLFPQAGRLQEALGEGDWVGLFDEVGELTLQQFTQPLREEIEASLAAGAQRMVGEVTVQGYSFTLANPRAVAYIQEHGAELVKGIEQTTKNYLRTVLTQAVSEGWSYNRTARAIIERFREFASGKPQQHIDSRAHLIAITELGNAYAEGNLIVARDIAAAGIPMEKAWQTVGDNRVSDGCRENEAAGWIGLEAEFPSGHLRPLRFPGCRCDALYRRAQKAEKQPAVAAEHGGRTFAQELETLERGGVLPIGRLAEAITQHWTGDTENRDVILTGERLIHIRERHPDLRGREREIEQTLLDPDEVQRNKSDGYMAIFYREQPSGYYLRAAVRMQTETSEYKHSLISCRHAKRGEVEAGKGRVVWRKSK